jgi:hypothetical protein
MPLRPALPAAVHVAVLAPLLGLAVATPSAPAVPRVAVTALPATNHAVVVTRAVPAPRPSAAEPSPRTTKRVVVVRAPAPRETPARRTTPAPKPTTSTRPNPTSEARMMAAVARIPGYRTGEATWVMTSKYGSWGTADWAHGIVYISPSIPADRMYDVVVHEWSHVLSVSLYPTNSQAKYAMNKVFGGTGLTGAERAADCMARLLGATWTNYTTCDNAAWKAAAAKLVARQPV